MFSTFFLNSLYYWQLNNHLWKSCFPWCGVSSLQVSPSPTWKSTSRRGHDPFASAGTGHRGGRGKEQSRRGEGNQVCSALGGGGERVILQLLQLVEGNFWSRWSQTCGKCTRTGQKLEHRKLQLSRRQVYFTTEVEQVLRGVVETLSFEIFKTWQVSLVSSHLCCSVFMILCSSAAAAGGCSFACLGSFLPDHDEHICHFIYFLQFWRQNSCSVVEDKLLNPFFCSRSDASSLDLCDSISNWPGGSSECAPWLYLKTPVVMVWKSSPIIWYWKP